MNCVECGDAAAILCVECAESEVESPVLADGLRAVREAIREKRDEEIANVGAHNGAVIAAYDEVLRVLEALKP